MKLHNTLTRTTAIFKPQQAPVVTLYTCGPTVYDNQHIGNFRKFVFDDMLRRSLSLHGYEVKHVMNITDVGHLVSDADDGEDKLEKGAKREGRTPQEVAKHFTEQFKDDAKKLNILQPNGYKGDGYARATDFIPAQIDIVERLIQKGFAYQTPHAIYFDVYKLASYGELTGQRLSDKIVAARSDIVTDNQKRNPQDFALWFFTVDRFADHSMRWPSPWGEGFPGWHLECSAIIHQTLGDPIDIHTGGVDNIGTHHVNEMAQTEAAFGHKLAYWWLHAEHLLVESQKMAKSLNNFITVDEVINKGHSALALRLLYLQSQYRSQMNFTWESIEAASQKLQSFQMMADRRWQGSTVHGVTKEHIHDAKQHILEALGDDINSPLALVGLNQLESLVNADGIHEEAQKDYQDFLEWIDWAFGLDLSQRPDISDEQKALIAKRDAARQQQDWHTADKLRNELAIAKIGIEDTESEPIWYRL